MVWYSLVMETMGNFVDKAIKIGRTRGLNQAAIARAVGVDPARLTEWKKGEGGPSLKVAMQMARIVGASLDELAYDDLQRPECLNVAEHRAIELIRVLNLDVQDVIRGLTAAASWRDSGGRSSGHAEPGVPPENGGRRERGTG